MERLIVVAGPTASGKTALAIHLAQTLGGEVVSADSMQIYRGMDIGTAKPTPAEQAQARHHMIDVADPGEQYSVSRYVEQADACVADILSRGKVPIVCGGTGLYIEALIQGRQFSMGGQETKLRDELDAQWQKDPAPLLLELARVDPASAQSLHPNDRKRVLRALEVYRATGRTISQHNQETKALPPKYLAHWFGLCPDPRQLLYDRINQRVTKMLEEGLVEETRQLWQRGLLAGTGGQAIGYKELLGYLRGECTLESAADTLRQKSRNYAKRQMTWFRRVEAMDWLVYHSVEEFTNILQISTRNSVLF